MRVTELILLNVVLYFLLICSNVLGMHFTFELEDNTKQCFFHDIQKDTKATMEFKVIAGGSYDIDCSLEDPDGLKLYTGSRKHFDSHEWNAQKEGAYKICFSNEFSTITHKIIYFELTVGNEQPLLDTMNRATALSQMDSACATIHDQLKHVVVYQTHFKLREAQGRIFAEDLSFSVQLWSFMQLIIIIISMVGQVLILRGFFLHKRTPIRTDT